MNYVEDLLLIELFSLKAKIKELEYLSDIAQCEYRLLPIYRINVEELRKAVEILGRNK